MSCGKCPALVRLGYRQVWKVLALSLSLPFLISIVMRKSHNGWDPAPGTSGRSWLAAGELYFTPHRQHSHPVAKEKHTAAPILPFQHQHTGIREQRSDPTVRPHPQRAALQAISSPWRPGGPLSSMEPSPGTSLACRSRGSHCPGLSGDCSPAHWARTSQRCYVD